ncbi:MAG: hypothetical protein DWQ05_08670 [Calditrichaeota bacterium]|nr:MAG: hypothetical protein DWQ05_08670 [Calditrichota bacterium]
MPFYADSTIYFFDFLLFAASMFFAYAEIHYRIPFLGSRYYKNEPEIIADIPRRLEPNHRIPLLLIVKDADKFPVFLETVKLQISGKNDTELEIGFEINKNIESTFWERIIEVDDKIPFTGLIEISVHIDYKIGDKRLHCINDNYKRTRPTPFSIFMADTPLPYARNYLSGDLHVHSSFTDDQLEFGASPEATAALARAMGHGFVGITDHSYDLDDLPDNYLINDPVQQKWKKFQKDIAAFNCENKNFVIIPGEEVSCGNAKGENAHFLIFNNSALIPGTGDGGEKWLQFKPDLTISEVINKLAKNAACFASHPESKPPIFQKLLLNRGKWHQQDYRTPGLHGIQIWNGEEKNSQKTFEIWRHLLLSGQRLFILAGTDAHGNFNRFRQITKPLWEMADDPNLQIFGSQRSIIYQPEKATPETLTHALQNGALAVTSGPFLALHGQCEMERFIPMGGEITTAIAQLHLQAISSPEFGEIKKIILYRGDLNTQKEEIIWQKSSFVDPLKIEERFEVTTEANQLFYYRAELVGEQRMPLKMQALTNPIWHSLSSK